MIKRLLREALWPPIAVVVLNVIVAPTPFARDVYWLLHLLGGAALAFFFHGLLRIVPEAFGALRPGTRYLLAFGLACTTALAWELAEFAIDQAIGTRLQEDLLETMSDLMFGVCGAAAYLSYAAFAERRIKLQ